MWSTLAVDEPEELTLAQLVGRLESRLDVELSMLSCRGRTIYSSLAPPAQQQAWMAMGVHSVAAAALGLPDGSLAAEAVVRLQASCYDEEADEDVDVPTVVYRLVPQS